MTALRRLIAMPFVLFDHQGNLPSVDSKQQDKREDEVLWGVWCECRFGGGWVTEWWVICTGSLEEMRDVAKRAYVRHSNKYPNATYTPTPYTGGQR